MILILGTLNNLQNKKNIYEQLKVETVNAVDQPGWSVINEMKAQIIDLQQKNQLMQEYINEQKKHNTFITFDGTSDKAIIRIKKESSRGVITIIGTKNSDRLFSYQFAYETAASIRSIKSKNLGEVLLSNTQFYYDVTEQDVVIALTLDYWSNVQISTFGTIMEAKLVDSFESSYGDLMTITDIP